MTNESDPIGAVVWKKRHPAYGKPSCYWYGTPGPPYTMLRLYYFFSKGQQKWICIVGRMDKQRQTGGLIPIAEQHLPAHLDHAGLRMALIDSVNKNWDAISKRMTQIYIVEKARRAVERERMDRQVEEHDEQRAREREAELDAAREAGERASRAFLGTEGQDSDSGGPRPGS